jgi:hypothetical protein
MTIFIPDIEEANQLLAAAVACCVFRLNDACMQDCQVREYCFPLLPYDHRVVSDLQTLNGEPGP